MNGPIYYGFGKAIWIEKGPKYEKEAPKGKCNDCIPSNYLDYALDTVVDEPDLHFIIDCN